MLNGLESIDLSSPDALEQIHALAKGLSDKKVQLEGKLFADKEKGSASAAELEALQLFKQNADVKIAEDAQSYADAKALTATAHTEALAKLQGSADSATAQLKVLLIDNGLSAALDGVNISKDLKAGAVAMLQAGVGIVDGKAMIGDKSLSDHVTEWSQTEQGKAFCLAPNNSGGDAQGGSGGGQSKPFKQWSLTEKTQLANSDPAEYKRLSKG